MLLQLIELIIEKTKTTFSCCVKDNLKRMIKH